MAFSRLQVDDDERSILYYRPPGKVPITVWVLRGLVGVLLLFSLISFVNLLGLFSTMNERITGFRGQLYQQSSWDFDTTVDGRWRYCRAHPDECVQPWGDSELDYCVSCLSGEQLDVDDFGSDMSLNEIMSTLGDTVEGNYTDCACLDLFLPFGWMAEGGPVQAPSVAYEAFVPCDENGCQETFFDLRDACADPDDANCWLTFDEDLGWVMPASPEDCGYKGDTMMGEDVPILCYADYPLHSPDATSYTGTPMLMFLGKEVLKVLNVLLSLVTIALGGVIVFLIFRWGMVLLSLVKGVPRAHHNMIRTGGIQIVVEFAKVYLITKLTAVSYPFANMADGGVRMLTLLIAVVAIGFALAPPTRRFFSYHKFVVETPQSAQATAEPASTETAADPA